MGRKIKREYENPLDNIYLDLCEEVCPFFHSLGFTPNDITSLSTIFGILSVYFLWKKKYFISAISYFIQYFFDCLDGHYARKYGMTSKFGDYYDHIKDVIVGAGIMGIFIYRKDWLGVFLIILSFICLNVHMGCQEYIYDTEESPTLELTKALSVCNTENAEDLIYITKWFGCGTANLLITVYIAFHR